MTAPLPRMLRLAISILAGIAGALAVGLSAAATPVASGRYGGVNGVEFLSDIQIRADFPRNN